MKRTAPNLIANPRRRQLLQAAGFTPVASLLGPVLANAQAGAVLPLDTPGLDHLDIIVEDAEAAARFYMALFNTRLHAQPFQGAQRYFVLLGDMNDKREVGYLAIGAANGRGNYIGHFCTSVANWRRDSDAIWAGMTSAIAAAGLGDFAGPTGFGGIFDDPDGIEIQFLPSPDTLVTAAVPSDLVPANAGAIFPLGVDYVHLHVTSLDQALAWYRILYGQESGRQGGEAWFDFPRSGTRLSLEQITTPDKLPGIARFGIKTRPFDRRVAAGVLLGNGATLLPAESTGNNVRFIDPFGITVELNPG